MRALSKVMGIGLLVLLFSTTAKGEILAEINGVGVTEGEFITWVKKCFRIGYRLNILQNKTLKKHILRMYCYERAILDEISKAGVYVKDSEVDSEVERLKNAFAKKVKDKIPFSRLLMERNITLSGLKNRIRYMIGVRKAVAKRVTRKKLQKYFKQYKRHFGGELVRASHILILTINRLTKKPYSESKKRMALKKIRRIRKEISSDGSNFEALARKYSESPSSKNGGDLGYFPVKGRLPSLFTQVAFRLKVREVSEVVESPYGYHLIHVTAHIQPKPVQFEVVMEKVKKEFIQEGIETFIREIKRNTRIVLHLN